MSAAAERLQPVRVLIVDDEPDLRLLLRTMLDLDQRIEVAGEAGDGGEALDVYRELRPDVLLLDQRMPVMNGLEVAERVLAEDPSQAVLLFTAFPEPSLLAAARALGVQGVLGKDGIDEIVAEILRVAG